MTAVLSAHDVLRREQALSAHDDNYSTQHAPASTDWKAKYVEVADMLAETRAELDDFQHSSKELEEELERELERTERAQEELKTKVAKAELERDEWKSKFMSLQTTHNTTTTSLQRELDTLRREHQQLKVQMRELEMGNDDLERNERAVSSSLAETEARYSRVLEEKILLEQELLDKASLEEECQRLKDDLRDANVENSILKDQLTAAQTHALPPGREATLGATSVPGLPPASVHTSSLEDLLSVMPPDLLLSDLSPPVPSPSGEDQDIRSPQNEEPKSPSSSTLSRDARLPLPQLGPPGQPNSAVGLARSTTMPSYSPSRLPPPRTPIGRPAITLRTSSTNTATASKSKGVQMVSEMRARVRILEQKIHTRVPRLRMGSSVVGGPSGLPGPGTSPSLSVSKAPSSAPPPSEDPPPRLSTSGLLRRRSVDAAGERKRGTGPDTSGWVLIMEDSDGKSPSPAPIKDKDYQRRRASSPSSGLGAYRPMASVGTPASAAQSNAPGASLFHSTMGAGGRRPQSRLSVTTTDGRTSTSTASTASSIPTPSSRPATPTFLPVPSSGIHNLKRSMGPTQSKRASLGASNVLHPPPHFPHRERPISIPSGRSMTQNKALPHAPSDDFLSPNVTIRASKTSAPPTASAGALGQSRIGRPAPLSGRKSVDGDSASDADTPPNRRRSGSTTLLGARRGY